MEPEAVNLREKIRVFMVGLEKYSQPVIGCDEYAIIGWQRNDGAHLIVIIEDDISGYGYAIKTIPGEDFVPGLEPVDDLGYKPPDMLAFLEQTRTLQ